MTNAEGRWITAKTGLIALLGYPVEHSLSPGMHNAAFYHMGLPYCYVALPVRPEYLGDAVRGVRALGLKGVNVTVPHKENILPYLDEIEDEARFIGAVNTVVNSGGRLKGYNTDGRGFMKSLEEEDVGLEGKNVFIMGAGGASRAISYYIMQKAKTLRIYDPQKGRLEKLVAALLKAGNNVSMAGGADELALEGADMLINATPLGLKDDDPPVVDKSLLKPPMIIGDLIYRETPLLKEAKRAGLKSFDGLGMLLWQGVLASELWTGKRPPHDVMRKALVEGLGRA